MNYIDGFIDAFPPCFDDEESQNEAAAQHQIEMDVLYSIGCQYSIKDADMKQLCQLANISFDELQNHSTNSTESTPSCLSQSSFSVHQVQENQPACAT
jgi:hypothetical protein